MLHFCVSPTFQQLYHSLLFNCLAAEETALRTNTHNHHKARYEAAKLYYTATALAHEIIVRLRFAAKPVRHGRYHVCCDD